MAFALLAPSHAAATTGEGSLDPTFGGDGTRTYSFDGISDDYARAVGILPGGGMYVGAVKAGQDTTQGFVTRLRADGTVDPSFGSGGSVKLGGPPFRFLAVAVALGPGGTVVVGGLRYYYELDDFDVFVARITSAGKLDATFGNGGMAIRGSSSTFEFLRGMVVEPDGSVVLVSDGFAVRVHRLTPDGRWDAAFGAGGLPQLGSAASLARLDDGRYAVVAGRTVLVLSSDGEVDSAFGNSGAALLPLDQTDLRTVEEDAQGRLVVTGAVEQSPDGPALLVMGRLTAAGEPDTTLGGTGYAIESSGLVGPVEQVVGAALDGRGRVVVALDDVRHRWRVVRLTQAGLLDTAFSDDGVDTVRFATSGTNQPRGMDIGRDGRIVSVGMYYTLSGLTMAVARHIGDAVAPTAGVVSLVRTSTVVSPRVSWTAVDDSTGVRSFDVRYRVASATSDTFGAYAMWLSATRAGTDRFVARSPGTYCFSARAYDGAGNRGSFGASRCVSIPVDDRALARTGAWTETAGPGYYRSTALTSVDSRASLRLPGAAFRRLALIATTCPECGTVTVSLDGVTLATVQLTSDSASSRVVIPVATSAAIRSGVISVRQVSPGRPVVIDGLSVSLA